MRLGTLTDLRCGVENLEDLGSLVNPLASRHNKKREVLMNISFRTRSRDRSEATLRRELARIPQQKREVLMNFSFSTRSRDQTSRVRVVSDRVPQSPSMAVRIHTRELTGHQQKRPPTTERSFQYSKPGSNRHGHCCPQDFKSGVSTYSTIRAAVVLDIDGCKCINLFAI